jgi:hypothetical protein
MKRVITSLGIMALIFFGLTVQSQNKSKSHNVSISIPEVALLDLEANDLNVNFDLKAPNEAGNRIDFSNAKNNQIWVNYSSVTSSSQPSRKICAYVEGEIPAGLKIIVSASQYTGNGGGRTGTPTGSIALSGQMQDIITQIGSCYTGNGTNNGHQLSYSLELQNGDESYSDLAFDNSNTISVTYVLTDVN